MSRHVVWVLGDEVAHDGELEDGLFELVDAVFGGEQGVEVFGDTLPGLLEAGVDGGVGEGAEQGFDQGLMGGDAGFGLLF